MTITLGKGSVLIVYILYNLFMQITYANPAYKWGWPCCQDEVQDAIKSYFEQLSINISSKQCHNYSVKCKNYKIVLATKVNFSHTV